MNVYGFADGDPVNFSDPMGLSPCPAALKVACGVAGRVGGKLIARSATLGALASAGRALLDGNRPLSNAVAKTFEKGQYVASVLNRDITVQRVFGGESEALGRFLTPSAPAADAVRGALQLPAGNAATHIADVVIKQGTTIYTGIVNGSTTGATQIYVKSLDALKVVGERPIP